MQVRRGLRRMMAAILIGAQLCPPQAAAQSLLNGYSGYDANQRRFVDSMVDLCTDPSKTEMLSLSNEERKYADPSKKDYGYVVANFQVDGEKEVKRFDCQKVGIGPVNLKQHKGLASGATLDSSCKKDAWRNDFAGIIKAAEDLHYQEQLKSCEKTGTKLLSSSCLKEVGCDVARSMIALSGPVGWLMKAVGDKVNSEFKSCTSPDKGSCMQSLIKGLIDDLWGMVEGIWSGIKWVGGKIADGFSWAGRKITETWNFLTSDPVRGMEQKTTKKVLAAAGTTKSQIDRFLSDPWSFIKNSVTGFMNKVFEGVSGLAKQGALAWKCATCTELLQGGCKIAGYIGGEVLLAFLTGGAVNIAGKVGKGLRGGAEIASILDKMGEAARATMKFASKMAATRLGRSLASVAKIPGAIFEGLGKIPVVGKLGRKFVELNEEAFMRGMLGKSGFSAWKSEKELGETVSAIKKIRGKSLAPEEKALIADHPEVEWSKLKKDKVEDLLTAFKQQDATHSDKIAQLKTLSDRNPLEAKKLAQQMADLEVKNAEEYAKHFSKEKAETIRRNAKMKAGEYLSAGDFKQSADYQSTIAKAEKSLGRPLSEAEKESVYKAHIVGNGELGKDGTFASKGNYTTGQIKDKLSKLQNSTFSPEERKRLLFDGVAGADSKIMTVPELMQTKPADANALSKIANSDDLRTRVVEAIDTRNQLYRAWKENPNDAKLYKLYKDHEGAMADLEYLSRKKLALKPEEAEKLFAKPAIAPAGTKVVTQGSTGGATVPAGAHSGASGLTADQSLEVIADYSKKYNGQKLADEREVLNKMPVSSEKGRRIDELLKDQESALKTLGDIKATHGAGFQKMANNRAALDADYAMGTRERALRESIEKLKAERESYLSGVKSANLRVESSATGDLSDYSLKVATENGKKPGASLMNKAKDQIADLERIQKNFKKGELPALEKVDLDKEIKRLKDFVNRVENPGAAAPAKAVDVDYTRSKVTTDEYGSRYFGYDLIKAKDASGKNIGYVSYEFDPESKILTIGRTRVEEDFRRQGHQTELFKKMLAEHPDVRTLRTSLDEVNQESFTGKLSKLVKAEKDYTPPAGPPVEQKHLDRLVDEKKPFEKELNECCGDYLANLERSDPKRFEAMMDEALKGTPAWKTREKFGFTEFGEMKNYKFKKNPKTGVVDLKIEFDATKPKP